MHELGKICEELAGSADLEFTIRCSEQRLGDAPLRSC